MEQKGIFNKERMDKIIEETKNLISDATLIIGDNILEIKNNNYELRLKEACKILVGKVYYNLSILNNYKYKSEDIKNFYFNAKKGIDTTPPQKEILDFINFRDRNSLRVTIKTIKEKFSGKSYGWSDNAILSNIAGLLGCKKIDLNCDGNLIIEEEIFDFLNNSRLWNNIIVQIKEKFQVKKQNI